MRNYVCYLIVALLCVTFSGLKGQNPSQKNLSPTPETSDEDILFDLGVALMLTTNYAEAEACFSKLMEKGDPSVELLNNQGVNLAMHGLSLLKKDEARERIKYVFPFEVSIDQGMKGSSEAEKERKEHITRLFKTARDMFLQCVEQKPSFTSGHLNLACMQVLLGRWLDKQPDMREGLKTLSKAEQLAKAQNQTTTLGYIQIVKGIVYDYIDNPTKRDELFEQAAKNHNVNVQSLASRNKDVAMGQEAVFTFTRGEKYDVFEDKAETIDGVSLLQVTQNPNLALDGQTRELSSARIHQKKYPKSNLYFYYESVNKYLMFHKTHPDYTEPTGKGIKVGASEGRVRELYGQPVREQAAGGGKYLYYQKAKIIFFIGNDEKVKHWMVWGQKFG